MFTPPQKKPGPKIHGRQASKRLRCWGQPAGGPATFHEMIARDKEVVKSVLLLTGSVEGIKNQVRARETEQAPGVFGSTAAGHHPVVPLTWS
jgi:hypothetical protein